MRIVWDTNCLVASLSRNSAARPLWDAFRMKRFELCYSTEMLNEYEEVIARYYSHTTAIYAIEILLSSPNVIHVTPFYKWNLIKADPDDNKFVDCALNAGAEFIVTNDKHFNELRRVEFPPVKVINLAAFKNLLL